MYAEPPWCQCPSSPRWAELAGVVLLTLVNSAGALRGRKISLVKVCGKAAVSNKTEFVSIRIWSLVMTHTWGRITPCVADGFATRFPWPHSHGHVPMEFMFLGKWKVEPLDWGVAESRTAVCTVDLTQMSEESLSHRKVEQNRTWQLAMLTKGVWYKDGEKLFTRACSG